VNKEFKFNYYHLIIIFFILFLIFEGIYYHHYTIISYYLEFLPNKNLGGYNALIWSENGLVEYLQVIILFIAIIYFWSYLKKYNKNLISYFYLIGLTYYFFEEISWGQHIFFWPTPNIFQEINTQNETNFHNASNLLNGLPRGLLLIWCSLSFLLIKLVNFKSKNLIQFILPNQNLKFLSILILLFVIPDLLLKLINLNSLNIFICFEKCLNELELYNKEIFPNLIIDIIPILTFNFIRLSELQELLFNLYIVTHAYYLSKLYD
tara:strand:- start:131 stop:922 length:792 start_codon:yes stop_codon:yes gene_type:complete